MPEHNENNQVIPFYALRLRDLAQLISGRLASGSATEKRLKLAPSESVLGCAGAPVLAERDEVDLLFLLAGVHRRKLSRIEAAGRPLVHPLEDGEPSR